MEWNYPSNVCLPTMAWHFFATTTTTRSITILMDALNGITNETPVSSRKTEKKKTKAKRCR